MKVGEWRWIRGKGPMKITELAAPPKKVSVTCRTPGGGSHWVGEDEILAGPTVEAVVTYYRDSKARSLPTEGLQEVLDSIFERLGPLAVACEQCGAEPEKPCHWPVGGKESYPHLPRRVAAKETKL